MSQGSLIGQTDFSISNRSLGGSYCFPRARKVQIQSPLCVLIGNVAGMIPQAIAEISLHHASLDDRPAIHLLEKTSPYQPILLVLNGASVSDDQIDELFSKLGSHLFFQVHLLFDNKQTTDDSRVSSNRQMLNPCLPISSFFLPKESDRLAWAIDDFFFQADLLAKNCEKLLRIHSLTDRESRITAYISRGYPNKKISNLEGVSDKTIERCRTLIYAKLGIRSGPELASLVAFKNHFRWPANLQYPTA